MYANENRSQFARLRGCSLICVSLVWRGLQLTYGRFGKVPSGHGQHHRRGRAPAAVCRKAESATGTTPWRHHLSRKKYSHLLSSRHITHHQHRALSTSLADQSRTVISLYACTRPGRTEIGHFVSCRGRMGCAGQRLLVVVQQREHFRSFKLLASAEEIEFHHKRQTRNIRA